MGFLLEADRFELGSQLGGQCFTAVSLYWQTAALLGPVEGEAGDDHVPTVDDGCLELLDVSGPVHGIGKEVEHGPVVPHGVGAVEVVGEHVGVQPADIACAGPEALLSMSQGSRGHIEHGQVGETYGLEPIDQVAGSAPDVDDRIFKRDAGFFDQDYRSSRILLIPTDRGGVAVVVDGFPVPASSAHLFPFSQICERVAHREQSRVGDSLAR